MRKSAWGITVASAIAITGMNRQAGAKDASTPPEGASTDEPVKCQFSDKEKELTTSDAPYRVAVHLANPPASRLRLSFDATDGSHKELEWDPAISSELTKIVDLRRKQKTKWRLTVAIEPSTYTQSQGTVLLTVKFDKAMQGKEGDAPVQLIGEYVALLASAATANDPKEVPLQSWPAPLLTLTCFAGARTRSMDDESFAPSAAPQGTGGMRGFGVAPAIVTDTLSLLTEIAVERAKAGAMRVLKQRFVEPICGTDDGAEGGLTLNTLLKTMTKKSDIRGGELREVSPRPRALGDTSNDLADRAFHRTCDLLQSLRLEDLLSSGKPLLTALRDDLRYSIAPALAQATVAKVLKSHPGTALAVLAIANAAIDRGTFDGIAAQAAIEAVIEAAKGAIEGDNNNTETIGNLCQARLAVTVMKRCSHGGCTAASILENLRNPETIFQQDNSGPWKRCWKGDKYLTGTRTMDEATQVILQGLELVAPVIDERGTERAKAAIRLVASLISMANGNTAPVNLQAFTEIAVALVDEDYATAMGRLIGILWVEGSKNENLRPLRKLSSLLGAVASYTSVYRATKDAAPEAARKARKQALESLIDGASDRAGREEEWITSIGSNVGFSFTATNRWLGLDDFEPGVRVPLGITTEYLPGPQGRVGVRLGAQVADLGQFVRKGTDEKVDEIEWADFLSPGVEAGLLLGRSVNLSLHVSYAPTVTKSMDTDGVWRVGLSLGYYVPFFDLN